MVILLSLLSLVVLGITFLPGYLLYSNFFQKENDSREYMTAISFCISLPIIASIHLLSFLIKGNLPLLNSIIYLLLIAGFWLRIHFKKIPLPSPWSRAIALFAVFNLYCFFLLILMPNYFVAYTFDWRLYYTNVLFFLHHIPQENFTEGLSREYLLNRTPFFSLINAFFLSFTRADYYFFQIVSNSLNTLLFWAIFLIARDFAGKKTAVIGLSLLPFIPILITNIHFPQTKPLAFFFILFTLYIYLFERRRDENPSNPRTLILLFFLFSTAFMFHPLSLFYLLWLIVDQIYSLFLKRRKFNWKRISSGLFFSLLIILPWYGWILSQFGIEKLLSAPHAFDVPQLSFKNYILSRCTEILSSLFIPSPQYINAFYSEANPILRENQWIYTWGNYIVRFYLETFGGGLTVVGLLFFITVWMRDKISLSQQVKRLLMFTCWGALLCVGVNLFVENKGQAFNLMGALVLAVYVSLCAKAANCSKKIIAWIMTFMALEFLWSRILLYKAALIFPQLTALFHQKSFTFLFDVLSLPHLYGPWVYVVLTLLSLGAYFYLVGKYEKNSA